MSASSVRAVIMMIGSSRVRASPRSSFASTRPDLPGSIQSSSRRSGSAALSSRLRRLGVGDGADVVSRVDQVDLQELPNRRLVFDDEDRRHHWCPPREARSFLRHLGADLLGGRMPDVDALDHLDDRLGDVLRVIADALDRLRDEHDLERRP